MMNGLAARTAAREMSRQRRLAAVQEALTRVVVYVAAVLAALLCAAPFLWGLVTAIGRKPTTRHVRDLFHSTAFPTYVGNTLIVGGLVVVVTLALALPAAYALARLGRPWGASAGFAILLVYLVPHALPAPSLSRVVATLGLADSLWSLVLVYPTVTVPVAVWLLAGFLRAVPVDVEEQALMDGHSRLGAFTRVVVPLALPGVAAVAVLTFILAAGEFTYALTFVWSGSRMPVSTGLPARLGETGPRLWRPVQAGVVLVAIPLAFAASLVLRRFLTGLAAESVGGREYPARHGDMGAIRGERTRAGRAR